MSITAELLLGATKITRKALRTADRDGLDTAQIQAAVAALEEALAELPTEREAA